MKDVKDKTTYLKAYKWAKKELEKIGCKATPIRIEGPYTMPPKNGNIYSMFDNGRGTTLFRIDFEDHRVLYRRIANFDELKFQAYPLVKHLLQTGVKLCDLAEGRINEFYLWEEAKSTTT